MSVENMLMIKGWGAWYMSSPAMTALAGSSAIQDDTSMGGDVKVACRWETQP
jgi:hypothetical protein